MKKLNKMALLLVVLLSMLPFRSAFAAGGITLPGEGYDHFTANSSDTSFDFITVLINYQSFFQGPK